MMVNFFGEMEILELDSFDPAFPAEPVDQPRIKRRFMTLLVPVGQERLRGGTGWVCKAFNSKGEAFALKRMASPQDGPLDPDERQRATAGRETAFREEYRSQLVLSHLKGFPRLYGYGTADGQPLIVMEWVEGLTLRQAAPELPRREDGQDPRGAAGAAVADIGISVLEALGGIEQLHRPYAHRDLSPSNIMLRTDRTPLKRQCETGAYDVCLVDLGSAAPVSHQDASFTMASDVWRNGTPEYAPPEMLTRDVSGLDELRHSRAVDVYALCSVLYELYAGHTPFRLAGQTAVSPYRAKTEAEPLPLEPADGDEKLVGIIRSGLAVRQEDRPSIDEMLARLRSYRAGGRSVPEERQLSGTLSVLEGCGDDAGRPGALLTMPSRQEGGLRAGDALPAGALESRRGAEISRRRFVFYAAAGAAACGLAGAAIWSLSKESPLPDEPGGVKEPETVPFTGGPLYLAQDADTGLWGYLDASRSWVVAPSFAEEPGYFSEGLAYASGGENGLLGYIDGSGSWVVPAAFAGAGVFSDGLAPARPPESSLWGYIDAEGAWAIEPAFVEAQSFANGLAACKDADGRWGYIDSSGAWAIDPAYRAAGSFADNGLAAAGETAHKWGYLDRDAQWAIPPTYSTAQYFSEGLAGAMFDGILETWGFINPDGSVAIEARFAGVHPFSFGLAAAKDRGSGLWGFIDAQGEWTVEPQFARLGRVAQGLAPAQDTESELWGYVDMGGNWIIPARYANVGLHEPS